MNWLGSWIKPAQPATPNGVTTLETLEDSVDALKSRKMQLMQKIYQTQKEAQSYYDAGQTQQAKSAIGRKKVLEAQLGQLDGQITKMMQINAAVESTAMSVDLAAAMKGSSLAMSGLLKQTSVSEIESIHDDLEGHMEDADLLTETLSRPFGGSRITIDSDGEELDWQSELKLPSVPKEKNASPPGLRLPVQSDSSGPIGGREKLSPL
jgi:phage shock protein A